MSEKINIARKIANPAAMNILVIPGFLDLDDINGAAIIDAIAVAKISFDTNGEKIFSAPAAK